MGEDILTFCYKGLPGHLACRAAAVSEYMSFASAVNEFAGVTNDDSKDASKNGGDAVCVCESKRTITQMDSRANDGKRIKNTFPFIAYCYLLKNAIEYLKIFAMLLYGFRIHF